MESPTCECWYASCNGTVCGCSPRLFGHVYTLTPFAFATLTPMIELASVREFVALFSAADWGRVDTTAVLPSVSIAQKKPPKICPTSLSKRTFPTALKNSNPSATMRYSAIRRGRSRCHHVLFVATVEIDT